MWTSLAEGVRGRRGCGGIDRLGDGGFVVEREEYKTLNKEVDCPI